MHSLIWFFIGFGAHIVFVDFFDWRRNVRNAKRMSKRARKTGRFALFFFLAVASARAQEMPDAAKTPGAIRISNSRTICATKWGKDARHVTPKMKRQVCDAYGNPPRLFGENYCPGKKFEIDHLISRELGGADDVRNLWPQPYDPRPGAHEKDRVENWLHRQVCAGTISLAEAQRKIRDAWYPTYLEMLKEKK